MLMVKQSSENSDSVAAVAYAHSTRSSWEETMKRLTNCKHPGPKLVALKMLTSSRV